MNTHQMNPQAPAARVSDADFSDIRATTISAFETPALFESVAEIAETSEDHDDYETEAGVSVSAYTTPLALWEMKTGRYTPTPRKRGLWSRMKWGVMAAACEDHDLEARDPVGTYIHPTMEFMSSRVDKEVTADGGATWSPMISYNVAVAVSDAWRNAIGEWVAPEYVILEAQHHMAVTGAETVYVVALIGGVSVRMFTVERDEDLIADIEETVAAFWDCVVNERQPSDKGARDVQVLNRLMSKVAPEGSVADMRQNRAFIELIERKKALASEKTSIDKETKAINAQLATMMDGNDSAIISDTTQIAWQRTAESHVSYTKKASASLRTKKINPKAAGPEITALLQG